MLKWPDRAIGALRRLFEPLQDVDVYVEDMYDEVFYRHLLNRVVAGRVRIARIFSLGGRDAILARGDIGYSPAPVEAQP